MAISEASTQGPGKQAFQNQLWTASSYLVLQAGLRLKHKTPSYLRLSDKQPFAFWLWVSKILHTSHSLLCSIWQSYLDGHICFLPASQLPTPHQHTHPWSFPHMVAPDSGKTQATSHSSFFFFAPLRRPG